MYRFLGTRRWVVGHALAVTGIALFVTAGFWQLSRLSERLNRNDLISSRRAEPAMQLETALASVLPSGDPGQKLEFTRVLATGVYQPEQELLVRSRSLNGQPGFHVVTPLVLESGAVLVNRGFVPQEFDEPPVAGAEPPDGLVTVEGRVRASVEPPRIGPRDPAEGELSQVFWLNVERIAQQLPYELAPITIELVSQNPPSSADLPLLLPEPVLDEGPHRGYAIQWFSFAIIATIGYIFLIRRTARRPGEG